MEYVVLRRVQISGKFRPTGKTKHHVYGVEMPTPSSLKIVKYPNDPGFYLFYCNDKGEEMTDTWHETLQKAFEQANWEFGVVEGDWEKLSD